MAKKVVKRKKRWTKEVKIKEWDKFRLLDFIKQNDFLELSVLCINYKMWGYALVIRRQNENN